jgi:hypothetical protein
MGYVSCGCLSDGRVGNGQIYSQHPFEPRPHLSGHRHLLYGSTLGQDVSVYHAALAPTVHSTLETTITTPHCYRYAALLQICQTPLSGAPIVPCHLWNSKWPQLPGCTQAARVSRPVPSLLLSGASFPNHAAIPRLRIPGAGAWHDVEHIRPSPVAS